MKLYSKLIIMSVLLLVLTISVYYIYSNYYRNYTGQYVNGPYEKNKVSIDGFDEFQFEQIRDNRYGNQQQIIAQGSSFQAYNPDRLESISTYTSVTPNYRCNSDSFIIFDMGELYRSYRYIGLLIEPRLQNNEPYIWHKSLTNKYTTSYTWATAADLFRLCLNVEFSPEALLTNTNTATAKDLQEEQLLQYINATISNQEVQKSFVPQ